MSHGATAGSLAAARSIGVFGGTFDPVHLGHLILAERACDHLGLDALLFVPALIPPHKRDARQIAPARHRAAMIELAIAPNPRFYMTRYELENQRVSFTVQTLRCLRSVHPESGFTLLIGSDNLREFPAWHLPDEILSLAELGVWDRPGCPRPTGIPHRHIPAPLMEISGTEIRERVASGNSIRYMTPDDVISYIDEHGLYR